MKIGLMALGAVFLASATPAFAGPAYTFDTTGNTSLSGAAGNSMTFTPNTTGSGLQVLVTAWQANQTTGAINSAYLGAYGGGLGVTGTGDLAGASGYHQIDNMGGYTDFLLLQFNKAVTLSSVTLHSYLMGNLSTKDNDLSWYDAGAIPTATWNAPINLAAYIDVPSLWTGVNGDGTDGSRTIGATTASTKWLISAAQLPTNDRDDGFKLASVTVNMAAAVPEPGVWAMMIAGFALIGAMMRGFRKSDERFTERMRAIAAPR